MKYAYINGSILPESDIHISPFDLGLLRSYAVFDVLRTYHKQPFMLTEHMQRLRSGAAALNLPVPHTDEEIAAIIDQLIEKNGFTEGQIRTLVTGGPSPDAARVVSPQFMILAAEAHDYPEEHFTNGVAIKTAVFQRQDPVIKTTNYIFFVKTASSPEYRDAFEILYVNDGLVTECATSNIFAVSGRALITPVNNVLIGMTRNFTIDLAHELGLTVEERDLPLAELLASDEVFLTASNKEIMPIVRVDETRIKSGTPGPVTRELIAAFRQRTRG